ncbi:MAG: YfhO family protein [Deltaproteobacteria bacterium]|nr:YfhO family protein [Deltaproteobacteria bacterium]MBW2151940.1 YfhO family protein [Deltaproteobacteria bacterium]
MRFKNPGGVKSFLPILFIFFLTIVFFYPVIFKGKTFYAFDVLSLFLPWSSIVQQGYPNNTLITDPVSAHFPLQKQIRENLFKGASPLWNDKTFCGIPLYPGTVSRYINPSVVFIFAIFSLPLAHDLILWLHMFGAGVFMFLFLKKIDLDTLPALVGSIAWMFNGYVMVWFEFEVVQILALALPAALYYFELWLSQKTRLYLLLFAFFVGITISSGFAHVLIYQLLFIASYVGYRCLFSKRNLSAIRKLKRKELLSLALVILLGIFISADFLVSHLASTHDIQRGGYSFQELYRKTGILIPKYLLTLLFPDFFGNPARAVAFTPDMEGNQPYNNYNELCIYAGILALFLSSSCLPYLFRRKHVPFFLFIALITLTMAMGSILYFPLARFLPGLNLSTPTRILFIFGFSISVLAAMGAQVLTEVSYQKKWAVFSLWLLLFFIAVILFHYMQTDEGVMWATAHLDPVKYQNYYYFFKIHFASFSPIMLKPMVLILITFLLLVLVLFSKKSGSRKILLFLALLVLTFDLMSFGRLYNTVCTRNMIYPSTNAIRFLQMDKSKYRIATYGNFLHNSFSVFGISDIGGYSSVYSKRYGEFLHLSQYGLKVPMPEQFSRWTNLRRFDSSLFDLINTKYFLFPPNVTIKSANLNLVYDGEIKIFENKNVFPRVFITPSYRVFKEILSLRSALAGATGDDLRKKVLLETEPPAAFRQSVPAAGNNMESKIDILSYTPSYIELIVATDKKGFLVISDNYHPGWKAKVDDEDTPIMRANYIMRAIPINPGTHKIIFIYKPKWIILSIIITIVGWLVLISLILHDLISKRTLGFAPSQGAGSR